MLHTDLTTTDTGAVKAAPVFYVPPFIESTANVEQSALNRNYTRCLARRLPDLFSMEEMGKYKPDRLALCGGGPSLALAIDDVAAHHATMACGSAHKFFSERDLPLTYAVNADADPQQYKYVTPAIDGCRYLVASTSHDTFFDALEDRPVWTWNSQGAVTDWTELPGKWIGGGGTVVTRSLNIAVLMGYRYIDVYGFDCSFLGDVQHAYAMYPGDDYSKTMVVRCEEGGKEFLTTPTFFSEAQCWAMMLKNYGFLFDDVKIHGNGLVAEMMAVIERGTKNV